MVQRLHSSTVRVLVGGDSSCHHALIGLLRADGYEVEFASDREEVCRLVRETTPDLVLVNFDLLESREGPARDALRSELDLSGACLIRLTGGNGESEGQRAEWDQSEWSLQAGLADGEVLLRLRLFLRVHRAEAAERRQAQRLEEMVRVQHEIASVKADPKGIMEMVAERAQQLTCADGAAVLMVSGDSLGADAATGMLAHLLGCRSRIDGTASGLCLQSDEVFECGDVENDERFRIEAEQDGGYQSSLVVPLRYQYNSVGVLKVVSRRRDAFLNAEGHALQFVAYFMATAINQAVALNSKQALLAEHTKTILALRESEERFRSAFDYASIGMALIRIDGRWLKVNHTLCGVVGYSEKELKALSFDSLTHPEDLTLHQDNVRELLSGEVTSFQVEERCFHKSGSLVWVLLNVSLLRDASSKPLNFIAQIQDITERKRAEDAFRMQARVLANMSEGVCLTDDTGVIVYTNRAEDRIFGYGTGELKGQHLECLMTESGESGQTSVSEVIQEVMTLGQWSGQFVNQRKDGETIVTEASFSMLEVAGKKFLICVQEDITQKQLADERIRNSLKEKEVLLKEIHHRVKNNLQVISSLLNLEAGRSQEPGYSERFRESQNRVRSMALIHENLYKSRDLARVDFDEYVASLGAMLFRSYGANSGAVRLELRIAPVHLSIDTAIPVGLLINELVSNSLKHAFPDGRQGTITIEFLELEEHRYSLKFSDDGVGFSKDFDLEKSTSLGLRLVGILTKQIGGQLTRREENGTWFTILFGEVHEKERQ